MKKSIRQVNNEIETNDPPIEINQRWVAYNGKRQIIRQLRILAQYPDPTPYKNDRVWIFIDEPCGAHGLLKHNLGDIRVTPEFNLRYVFRLKRGRAN